MSGSSSLTRSCAPEVLNVELEGDEMPEDKRKCILLHADTYAFGLLISEILTGCMSHTMYKKESNGNVKKATIRNNANVGAKMLLENSGDFSLRRDIE